jgi:hypothetical protein
VQYFIAGLQAKDVLFQESIFVVKLLDGFSQPRAPRWRRGKFQYPVNKYKDSK